MVQIELEEQDLEKVDRIVKNGIFHSREIAIKAIIESLSDSSVEEIERMEKAKHEASMFLEIYMGNMLYPGTPIKAVMDGKEMYKISVKSATYENSPILGYVYVDAQRLEVDVDLSTDFRSLPEMSEEELEEIKKAQSIANNYCEKNLDGLYASAPRRINVEGEEEFEVIIKGKFNDKTWICGYLFLDVNKLTVKQAAIDRKRINKLKTGENINEGSVS